MTTTQNSRPDGLDEEIVEGLRNVTQRRRVLVALAHYKGQYRDGVLIGKPKRAVWSWLRDHGLIEVKYNLGYRITDKGSKYATLFKVF